MEKCQNQNFWQFGFQHVPISDVQDFKNFKRIWFGLYVVNQTKNVPKLNEFGFQTQEIVQNPNENVRNSDTVPIPNRLELGQNLIVWNPNMFGFQALTVFKNYSFFFNTKFYDNGKGFEIWSSQIFCSCKSVKGFVSEP